MSNSVVVEQTGRKVVIRFNRPEIRNPLSVEVLEHLSKILDEISDRDDIEIVIFTGVDEVFASGADLREIADLHETSARDFAERGQRLMRKISELKATPIAAINGVCFGGALDLALACRQRIASPDAIFSHPGANLGIMTGWGGTQRLPRLIGQARAIEMFFTAARLNADSALNIGLVDQVVEEPLESILRI